MCRTRNMHPHTLTEIQPSYQAKRQRHTQADRKTETEAEAEAETWTLT